MPCQQVPEIAGETQSWEDDGFRAEADLALRRLPAGEGEV